MSSPIRTALVGVGVVAVCYAMASLKGHHLLMAFAAASLLCGIRSWLHNSNRPVNGRNSEAETYSRRSGRQTLNNVYQFPNNAWNISDASGS